MKICFLLDDYSATGGIQTVVPIVANELTKYHEVYVLSMYQEHSDNNVNLYKKEIKPTALIEGRKKYIRQAFKVVSKLEKDIEKNNTDVLIACSEMLTPYAYLATKRNKASIVCWCHTNARQSKFVDLFKVFASKKSNLIVVLNDKNKAFFEKNLHARCKTVLVPNPNDPKLMINDYKYDTNCKKIISVGRISREKYYEKLVEVASLVCKKHSDWQWDIYGDGPERNKIDSLIKENKLNSFVYLKGNVSDIYDRYHLYSLLVMTSKTECYPMVLLEGMANKLPLISFKVPGAKAIIEDDVNGYLIECFDALKMANKICELIEDKEKRVIFSNNNNNLINEHSIDVVAKYWNSILNEVSNG